MCASDIMEIQYVEILLETAIDKDEEYKNFIESEPE